MLDVGEAMGLPLANAPGVGENVPVTLFTLPTIGRRRNGLPIFSGKYTPAAANFRKILFFGPRRTSSSLFCLAAGPHDKGSGTPQTGKGLLVFGCSAWPHPVRFFSSDEFSHATTNGSSRRPGFGLVGRRAFSALGGPRRLRGILARGAPSRFSCRDFWAQAGPEKPDVTPSPLAALFGTGLLRGAAFATDRTGQPGSPRP